MSLFLRTDQIASAHIGRKIQTADCPPDYYVIVQEIVAGNGHALPGFWAVDIFNTRYFYDNPKIEWLFVPERCVCPFLRKRMKDPQAIIQSCPSHGFKVYEEPDILESRSGLASIPMKGPGM